jgi:MoaA/NifB/PqqE/SkfB family radical SAM enzyme
MKKIFFVSTENGCNNNCIGCADNNVCKPKNGRAIEGIFGDLEAGARKGYQNLHLAGGEVTIQDNIFEVLEKAKKLYNKIYITSNGRMFAYISFAKKMAESGVTDFNITLAGHNQRTHEAWTNTPGSFEQTINGIKNLKALNKNVCINYLVWRKSFNEINKAVSLLQKMGIAHIDFFNLVPLGKAKKIYSRLYIPLKELAGLEEVQFSSISNVEIEDFPLCVFSKEFRNQPNIHIFDTSGKIYKDEKGRIENYSLFAAREFNFCINSNLSLQKDVEKAESKFKTYRIKINACEGCSQKESCGGIFADYVNLVGEEKANSEIAWLRKKQGY